MKFISLRIFSFINVLIISSWSFIFCSCSHYYTQSKYENQQIRITDDVVDSSLVKIIEPYKNSIGKEINDTIGIIGNELIKNKPESTLGNFICDVLLKEGKLIYNDYIDFAVYNYGGIRSGSINEGPVTKEKIYELLPFENFAAVVNLDGRTTALLIQKIIDEEGWPVSGIRFEIKNNKPENILINNVPFDSTNNYKIIMNDYMATGGDNLFFLPGNKVDMLGVTIRDLIMNYIQKENTEGRKIYSTIDGRINYAE